VPQAGGEKHGVSKESRDCAHFGTPDNTLYGTNPKRKWMDDQGPEQRAIKQFFLQQREAGLRPGLMMDIHGGGGWRNHNILSDYQTDRENVPDDSRLEGADLLKPEWFALLDEVAGLREVWRNWNISGPVRAGLVPEHLGLPGHDAGMHRGLLPGPARPLHPHLHAGIIPGTGPQPGEGIGPRRGPAAPRHQRNGLNRWKNTGCETARQTAYTGA